MDQQLTNMLQRTGELHAAILNYAAEFRPQEEARQVLSFNAGILSLEQALGILHLFKAGHISPGITLLRTQFESLVRGVWLLYAAEAEWVERLRQPLTVETAEKANDAPMLSKMFKQLANSPSIQPALLVQLQDCYELSKSAFNSFAHGGMHPLSRVWMGYPPKLVISALRNSNAVTVFAAQLLSVLSLHPENSARFRGIFQEFSDCLPDVSL